MKPSYRLFRKWDMVALVLLLLLPLLLFVGLQGREEADTVLVLYGGEEIERVPLPTDPFEKTYTLSEGSVTVAFDGNGAAIIASTCPRGSCVESGKITQGGSGSYCLPLRFAIVLTGEGGLDGVTG